MTQTDLFPAWPEPKPTALLKLRGSFNPTLHGRERQFEPIAQGELADEEPPLDLTPTQEDFWRYAVANMPRGVMKRIDRDMLRIWVEAADRHNTARLKNRGLRLAPSEAPVIQGACESSA